MKLRSLYLALVIASLILIAGCANNSNDNPTRPEIGDRGLIWGGSADRYFSAFVSTSGNPGFLGMRAYTPPGYYWQGNGRPYPILYLLAPFRADERYFVEHGLGAVADRLIAEGKIEPMIIATVDTRSLLGGSFLVNSVRQGNYFDVMFNDFGPDSTLADSLDSPIPVIVTGESFITKVEEKWYRVIDDPACRAIGGVGIGGYGAVRAALETGLFGSVSAINAPLDFDGADGNSGFISLMNQQYPLNNDIVYDTLFDTLGVVIGVDTIWTAWMTVDTSGSGFIDTTWAADTSMGNPDMSLLVSAAAAFSAHHTGLTNQYMAYDQFGALFFGFEVSDTLTDDLTSYLPKHAVHMPFDKSGALNWNIWPLWMANNIEDVHQRDDFGYAARFDVIPKLIISSNGAKFFYEEQMAGFASYLTANNITFESNSFQGNDNLSGTADLFLYDLLEDILIFHSNNFDIPEELQ